MKRLEVYNKLRALHAELQAIPFRQDEWEQNALNAVNSTLYLAEQVFGSECSDETLDALSEFVSADAETAFGRLGG